MADLKTSRFCTHYDIPERRRVRNEQTDKREPMPHQRAAHAEIGKLYKSKATPPRGGILVLPTGAGKTFTALYFICSKPLSEGYKVLWLAHTHHLLEQAASYFDDLSGLIEGKKKLTVRVVSGTPPQLPIHTIEPDDDVVICSLQSAANAVTRSHPSLDAFLKAAGGKLIVVFDEAHHAPAPTYRTLIEALRTRCPEMFLLGLTATPIYNNELQQGWLLKLFPQNILYQVSPQVLMAKKILAVPVLESAPTEYEPTFDERAFQEWTATYRDLPEDVISQLATNQNRNDAIVSHYLNNREKYGKTIIFADRWLQCVYLCAALNRQKKKGEEIAGAVFSFVDDTGSSADVRNRRTAAEADRENAKAILDFKKGRLDVLVNVRMLTEGSDFPKVQTVFLTRQTTSSNLLTQMVGRGLRGTEVGGTEKLYVVSFIDDWKRHINFAGYNLLYETPVGPTTSAPAAPPPLDLVSIELVRRLSEEMATGIISDQPYTTLLPAGWYLAEYSAARLDEEQVEPMRHWIMVFDNEVDQYRGLIAALLADTLESFQNDAIQMDDARQVSLAHWKNTFFADDAERVGSSLEGDLVGLARHVAQHQQAPRFFPFEERRNHNLDEIAQRCLSEGLSDYAKKDLLQRESRTDRFWKELHNDFQRFWSDLTGRITRLVLAPTANHGPSDDRAGITESELHPLEEPSEQVKKEVKKRDGFQCLCCGCTNKRLLQIDHVVPRYLGGTNDPENLQTLCKACNKAKGINIIRFRTNQTILTSPPAALTLLKAPQGTKAQDPAEWEMFLRQSINFYFGCAAVNHVEIGSRAMMFRRWNVWLFSGNDAAWLDSHKAELARSVREACAGAGHEVALDEIVFYSKG